MQYWVEFPEKVAPVGVSKNKRPCWGIPQGIPRLVQPVFILAIIGFGINDEIPIL
jgi:hypothetical protein